MTVLPSVALTDRFVRAIDYARIAHAAQVRKGDPRARSLTCWPGVVRWGRR